MRARKVVRLNLEALEPRLLLNATVTDANILAIISTDNGTTGVAGIGDVVRTTWDNSASGDNNAALVDGVFADYSQLGGPSNIQMFDDGTHGDATSGDNIFTIDWTVVAGSIDDTNLNVSVTATDAAGAGHDADTSNLSVDSIAPNVTDGNITTVIYYDYTVTGIANIGDTLRVTWNNSGSGDNSTGINDDFVGATADFSQFGGPAAVTMVDNGTGLDTLAGDGIYTAYYTIAADSVDADNLNVSVTATDDAGNQTTTADSANLSADINAPTVTDGNIAVTLVSDGRTIDVGDIGDELLITWDNSAAGDNNADTIDKVTVDLSSIGGPSSYCLNDSGYHGDEVSGDGIYSAIYKIQAGNLFYAVRNVSVTVTDDAGNSTTTGDTTGLTYFNGPTVTFSDYGVDVWIYDVKGDIDIYADQFDVRFEDTGDVNSIRLLDPNMGEGLGIVISNARKVESIIDARKGDALSKVSFIASDAYIAKLKLNSGMYGYNLNGLNLDGLYFADNIDGDCFTWDKQAIWGSEGMGKATINGYVKGDFYLQGTVALASLKIYGGDYHGDMTLVGNAGSVSIIGGNLKGDIDVYGFFKRLSVLEKKGVGGVFRAGSDITAEALKSGKVSTYETDKGGHQFGFDLGGLGKLKLGNFSLRGQDTPFFDGDFAVEVI